MTDMGPPTGPAGENVEQPVPPPSIDITYRWADGDCVGDYEWMTTDDQFYLDQDDAEAPRDMLVERWERASAEVKTVYPPLSFCRYDPCDEDAVCWQTEDDGKTWTQACEKHRHPLTGSHSGRRPNDG